MFPHSFGDWKSKIKGPEWPSSREAPLPGLQMATFWLCPHGEEREQALVFLLKRTLTHPIISALPSGTHLNLITPQIPRLHTPSHWGLGFNIQLWGFPGGIRGKEPTCQCRRHKRCEFDSGVGKAPWRRACNPLQYPCLENPMDRGAWRAAIHNAAESDMTEVT